MYILKIFIVILSLIFNVLSEQENENEVKVIVGSSPNVVIHRPGVKPTAKPVSHIPGVPPSGTSNIIPIDPNTSHSNVHKPINNHPFNWISSLFGSHRTAGNNTNFDVEILNGTELNTSIVESEPLIIKTGNNVTINNLTYSVMNPETGNQDKGVIEWVLGLVGIQPPNQTKPPTVITESQQMKMCTSCTCGVSFKQTRIVGGVETQVNAYPWMTILTYNGRFYCGASVINSKYLLTATHCVNGFNKDRLQAVFLDHDRNVQTETQTFTRKIAAILKHRGYNQGGSYNNDISLLRLDKEVSFTGLLKPVCLPTIGKSYTGYTGIVTGWGATEEHGQVSNKLREVEVPIMSNIDCRKTGYGNKITDNMMCAGYKAGKKDSCQGDSGGPLHIVNRTLHTIAGIVSWGEGCAEPNYPGVYTRVNRYISWIKSNTKDACYCS